MVLSTFFTPLVPSTFAEAGDWYTEHKAFFDGLTDPRSSKAPEAYVDLLKKYNQDAKTIEPGTFDVEGYIYKFMFDQSVSGINFIQNTMTKFVLKPDDLLKDATFNEYKDAVKTLAITVLSVFIMFNMVKILSYRMGDPGDGTTVMNEKIVNIFVVGIFLFLYDQFIYWIINAQDAIISGIITKGIKKEIIADTIASNMLMLPGPMSFIAFLVVAILFIILVLQFYYRVAFVGLLYMFGPIAIATKMNDTYNFFDFWLKTLVSSFLTLILQMAAVAVGISKIYAVPEYYGDTMSFFVGISMFIVAMVLPSVLGQWGMSTGTTRAVSSGAKTAVKFLALRR